MKIIRAILGSLILFIDWLTTPGGAQRNADAQAVIDEKTSGLTLYQYKACPFCVKVRRTMKRNSLAIATKDAKRSEAARSELLAGGGLLKVPCLKIEDKQGNARWMYESKEIIGYLEDQLVAG